MLIYKKGNLLNSNCDIIVHQVNCQKVMGSGIAKQIRDRWPQVYDDYCYNIDYMYENDFVKQSFELLGMISWTELIEQKYIVNFFSQDKYLPRSVCHTNYDAFRHCCQMLKKFIVEYELPISVVIGFPYKIGCGLAGGDWSIVEKIIEEEFEHFNVEIWQYED